MNTSGEVDQSAVDQSALELSAIAGEADDIDNLLDD